MKKTNVIVKIAGNGREYLVSRTVKENNVELSKDITHAKKYTHEGARKVINTMKGFGESDFYSLEIKG